jgi:hypothetical protein
MLMSVLIAAALIAVLWYVRQGSAPKESIPLIGRFEAAEKRSQRPPDEAFSIIDQDIGGESRQTILTVPASRLIFRMPLPRDAWLRTWIAVKPESWDKEGDGVLFRIGVSDGRNYEELLTQHVNPLQNQGDRRWIPINLDLSAYGEQQVELIFNTNTSPAGRGDDPRNDLALWGAPEVYVR